MITLLKADKPQAELRLPRDEFLKNPRTFQTNLHFYKCENKFSYEDIRFDKIMIKMVITYTFIK